MSSKTTVPVPRRPVADAPTVVPEPPRPAARDSFVALRAIVDVEDLSVVFQPIVRLESGTVFAYEALVRCRSATIQSPPALFEAAMAANCVGRLGRTIREIAIPLSSGRRIFVNAHPQELNESWLIRPDDPLFSHDEEVFLEITESVPLSHFERCLDVLREIRGRGGVHLVVDDLGAGYSNLKTIADLEPKVVKLDRELICGLDRSRRQRQLVSGVVSLCRDLDVLVVAEGIETHDEYLAVVDTGAHFGQGYLFARPCFPMPVVTWPPQSATPVPERRAGQRR
ncbi:MAG: EAL domain-containing protein [Polyangiaceae bacterium]|nr:EAL domain-containing protein [Polyangiaceae bacterium]